MVLDWPVACLYLLALLGMSARHCPGAVYQVYVREAIQGDKNINKDLCNRI